MDEEATAFGHGVLVEIVERFVPMSRMRVGRPDLPLDTATVAYASTKHDDTPNPASAADAKNII